MQTTSIHHPNITLYPYAPSRVLGLDVMLRLIANGRAVPHTGGIADNSGSSFFGYGSNPHRTIWCVVPVFDGGDAHTLLRRALLQGLQRAAIHDLQKVGIELAPIAGSAIPAETVATISIKAVYHFVQEAFQLEEFRLIGYDAAMFTTAKKLIFRPGE